MNKISKILRSALPVFLLSASLSGCGGGGDTPSVGTTAGYTIGGTVSGLTGAVVLQNNGGDNLAISTSGNFTFASKVNNNGTYAVTILTQPSGQICSVSTGAGTVSGNNVSNVAVVCSASAYTVGGTVSGLAGSMVLQNNNGDNLTVSANGAITFATPVAQGSPYSVAVVTQPTGQTCSVANGTGTIAGANIGNVVITCAANTFTVGGMTSGLAGSVVLQNNNGDNLTVSTNGTFTFAGTVGDGGPYAITVLTQPAGQTCSVSTGFGTVSGNNVSNVAVTCSANTYTVGGTVSGLTGSMVLQDNNGDNLTVSANGAFTFATPVAQGSPYAVTVLTQPSGQNCSVANGTGTASGANIGNVAITCASNMFTVGGTVSGLTGSVVMQDNNGNNLTVSANGSFTFPGTIVDGSVYTVTVLTQPAGQYCTVSAGTGTVSGGNVTGIALVCVNNTYEIIVDNVATSGGTWSGTNPDIFTPNAPMATVSVTDIQSRLNAGTAVTLTTSPSALGDGNIFVSSTVPWTASTLKLAARRNIIFNTAITGSGTAGLALEYGQGAVAAGNTGTYSVLAPVNLANTGSFSTKLGSDGAVINYAVITSLGAVGSTTGTDLRGINGNLAGNYVLGADIDATGSGFTSLNTYTGSFDGLGHTVNGLNQSLFAYLSAATVRNVGLTNVNITNTHCGAVAWKTYAASILHNVYATGTNYDGGGLVGQAFDGITIADSHAAVALGRAGTGFTGGLLGRATRGVVTIRNSYATGNISGQTFLGGLLGVGEELTGATIENSYATGNVTATGFMADYAGGLVGVFYSTGYTTISNSYATGIISGNDHVGGLVGAYNVANGGETWTGATTRIPGTYPSRPEGAIVLNSYASGNVSGNAWVGGLIGGDGDKDTQVVDPVWGLTPITVQNSHATGNVTGTYYLGGLVGHGNTAVTISGSYATGSVTGTIKGGGWTMSNLGGLLGGAEGVATLTNSHATGAVYGTGQVIGGLAGMVGSGSTVSGCYATGNVTGAGMSGPNGISSSIGGLIGSAFNGALTTTISDTYATGNVSGTALSIGGLIGALATNSTLTRSYSSGSVVGLADTGSLIGTSGGTVVNSYWNADTSGKPVGVGANVGTFGAIGKTTAEMKSQATFTGWDFVSKWQIVEGVSYPTLR